MTYIHIYIFSTGRNSESFLDSEVGSASEHFIDDDDEFSGPRQSRLSTERNNSKKMPKKKSKEKEKKWDIFLLAKITSPLFCIEGIF